MKASVRAFSGDTSHPASGSEAMRRRFAPPVRALLLLLLLVCVLLQCGVLRVPVAYADGALDLSAPGAHDAYVERLRAESQARKAEALAWALQNGMPIRQVDGQRVREIMALCDGRPLYYVTNNVEAAVSVGADRIRDLSPWDLDGEGFIVGIWDGASVCPDHPEFQDAQGLSRVTAREAAEISGHATHVVGTIAARGLDPAAKGMAPRVRIESYNWDDDTAKMSWWAADAPGQTDKIYVSNHSYGFLAGWVYAESEEYPEYTGWYWYNPVWDGPMSREEWFGQYGEVSRQWDDVAYHHPYYLAFTSAGNDRGDNPEPGDPVFYWTWSGWSSTTYDPSTCPRGDGEAWGGYGTISGSGVAKNVMTVGAVDDAILDGTRGLSKATMTDFSCWGPTDDGRIKPDIVATGVDVYSACYDEEEGTNTYESREGTSMACPTATGAAVLLVQYYDRLFPGDSMRASTLKGLILHTADDLGRPGPDYQFGWGLMNATAAAELLQDHHYAPEGKLVIEGKLDQSNPADEYYAYVTDEAPIRITLCWTDPAIGTTNKHDDPTVRLIHDLDLRLVTPDGALRYCPWVLDPADPCAPAGTGDNRHDNIEQIYIPKPPEPGMYTIRVTHKRDLTCDEQYYSLISSTSLSDQCPLNAGSNKTHMALATCVAVDDTPDPPDAYAASGGLSITGGDTPPLAQDMMVFVRPKRATTFELDATDDGQPDPPGELSYTVASLPQHGQLNSRGQFLTEPTTLANFASQLTYFPDQDFVGRDTFTFYVDDAGTSPDGGASNTATVTLMVMNTETCELEIETSADDACIGNSGRNQNSEGNPLYVGLHTSVLRFARVNIPPESEILEARLQISAATPEIKCPIDGILHGEAAGDAANFRSADRDILELARTSAAVPWMWGPEDSVPLHTYCSSPNLAEIVQEIVDRPDWEKGNALVLIYSSRVYHGQELEFSSYDSIGRDKARLNITYALDTGRAPVSPSPVSQQVPVARSTKVATLWNSPATIVLSATDDGLPDPPGGLIYALLSLPAHGELTKPDGEPVGLYDLLSEDDNELIYRPDPTFMGRDRFVFHALDGIDSLSGRMSNPATVTLEIPSTVTREFQVLVDEDDAYASDFDQTTLSEFLRVGRHSSGMRFKNVDIPPGSEILSAFLKVSAGSDSLAGPVAGAVQAEASLHPTDFTEANPDLYDRLVTDALVPWTWQAQTLAPMNWYASDDIGAVVQEIVDQPGWLPGNAIAILYSGDAQNSRDIEFFGCAHPNFDRAAKIQITYDPNRDWVPPASEDQDQE